VSIYIEWLYNENIAYNALMEQSVAAVLSSEGVRTETEVAITLVDNESIHQINLEQRQVDAATDVLSFPMIHFIEGVDKESQVAQEPINPENNEVYLGDVVISWDKVVEQSADYGHSLERELSFLIVHSILHLLGYDHMDTLEEEVMIRKQKEIMLMMGLKR